MHASEERVALAEGLRVLGELPPDHVVLMLDAHGDILSWSVEAEELFEHNAADVLGRHVELLVTEHERAAGAVQRELDEAAAKGSVERTAEYRTRSGKVFHGITTVTSLKDVHEVLRGHVMLIESMSRQIEDRYAFKLEQADRVLRTAPVGVTVQDADGRMLYANETAARLCGYPSPSALIASPRGAILSRFALLDESGAAFPPDLLPGHRVLAGEEPDPVLLQVRERTSGRRWWSRIFAKAVRGASGRPELAINVWHDVTEEQRRKEQVQHLLELTAELVKTLDFEERLERLAEDLVSRFADWCAIDLVESGVRQPLVVRGAKPELLDELRSLASRRTDGSLAMTNIQPTLIREVRREHLQKLGGGTRCLELLESLRICSAIVVPIANERRSAGALVLATSQSGRVYDQRDLEMAREISERASGLLDNARSYRAALEAVRMRDDFLSVAAHELRTPLASLSLLLETLRESPAAQVPQRVELGVRLVRRLAKLVEVLLDAGRLTSGHLELELVETDVGPIVKEAVMRFAPEAELAGCELCVDCDEPCRAEIDRLRVDQVVSNLVTNALKYGAKKPVRIACGIRNDDLHIEVSDQGIGIAPRDHERIFRRFERAATERGFPGLGLGLWIVREIVAAHGGRIDIRSEEGHGATFDVVLPRSHERDVTSSPAS